MLKTNEEKRAFLQHAKDLAMELEEKTNKAVEIKIGVFDTSLGVEPVTILVNHPEKWFGDFSNFGWNTNGLLAQVDKFTPVPEDYLVLNELIDECLKE